MGKYYNAKINDQGVLLLEDKKHFLRSIRYMGEGDYVLHVMKRIDGNQRDMQKLYFAILGEWCNDTGWTKDELHTLVKDELFLELFDKTSTTDLDPTEWTILIMELENFLIIKFENS